MISSPFDRSDYPSLRQSVYLNQASLGLIGQPAVTAMHTFIDTVARHDLKAMLTVSEAVTRSALARQESRGAHSRIDHPHLDADWGTKNNVIVREGEAMALYQTLVPEMPGDLSQLLADEK